MSAFLITICLIVSVQDQKQDPIFSGPQVGESVAPFVISGVFGEQDSKEIDLVKQAGGGPLLLMFVHERTRPAFGLTNALSRYAASLEAGKLTCGICYLTKDTSEARMWMQRIEQYFDKSVTVGISPDGLEGPGEYGLNRNVAVTILVVNQNKVAANFALIEPNLHIDGQEVIDATSKMLATDSAPKITQFVNRRGDANRQPARNQMSSELATLLRKLINKQATREQVDKAARQIGQHLKKHPEEKSRLGDVCRRIVNSRKLENYGTEYAQKFLTQWSQKYKPMMDEPAGDKQNKNMKRRDKKRDDKF